MRVLRAILLCSCALGCFGGDDKGAAGSGGAGGGIGGGEPVTCDGDYVIEDLTGAAGMAENVSVSDIANCTTITGYLSIRDAEEVSLPRLEKVVGFVEVHSDTLETLSLPALTSVEGHVPIGHYSVSSIGIRAGALESLDLSSLTTLGSVTDWGEFQLVVSAKLSTLDLPALTTVGHVTVETASVLTEVNLPLVVSSSLVIRNNAALSTLNAPKLEDATDLRVEHNISLQTLELPALAKIGNVLNIWANDALETVNLPALTSVGLDAEAPASSEVAVGLLVVRNPSLTSLTAPSLAKVAHSFQITGNAMLPTCQAQAILEQVTLTNATPMIEDNAGTCP